jgi:hypothetical protein
MAHVTPQAYSGGMTTTDRERQRVIDAVTMASLAGIGEAEIYQLVSAGMGVAGKIEAARVPIDWDHLPTIGSVAA